MSPVMSVLIFQVHLFGASLGGFLAQKFAEYTHKSPRVHSLMLCNSFSDTTIFNQTWTANRFKKKQTKKKAWRQIYRGIAQTWSAFGHSFWLMPAFMLKKIVLGNFAKGPVDSKMADAIDFMVDRVSAALTNLSGFTTVFRPAAVALDWSDCVWLQLESLNQSELASRLTLNCQNSYVEPHKIKDVAVTIIDVSVNNYYLLIIYYTIFKDFFFPPWLWLTCRCSIRVLCLWRPRRTCTSCTPTLGELTWKLEGISPTCAGVPKSTFTFR